MLCSRGDNFDLYTGYWIKITCIPFDYYAVEIVNRCDNLGYVCSNQVVLKIIIVVALNFPWEDQGFLYQQRAYQHLDKCSIRWNREKHKTINYISRLHEDIHTNNENIGMERCWEDQTSNN